MGYFPCVVALREWRSRGRSHGDIAGSWRKFIVNEDILEMFGKQSFIKRKLQYGDRNPSVSNCNTGTLSRGFENSFQEDKISRHRKSAQHDIVEKWETAGKGFADFKLIQLCSAKDKRKRKLADMSPVKELKTQTHLLDEETDQLSISCLSSEGSESEMEEKNLVIKKQKKRCIAITHAKKTTPKSVREVSGVTLNDVDLIDCEEEEWSRSPPSKPEDLEEYQTVQQDLRECISSYDSESEEVSMQTVSRPDPSEKATDDISIPSSRTTSPKVSPSQAAGKMKAGDWLKNIQWQGGTPKKSTSNNEMSENLEDSAKKKKKYARCSMAEQLCKLQSREKSAQTVWYHKVREQHHSAADSSMECSKFIKVQLSSLETSCSLCVATCTMLSCDGISQSSLQPVVMVMFPQNSAHSHKLRKGLAVRIHPPWQTLDMPALGHQVLLCVYYSVLDPVPSGTSDSTMNDATVHDKDLKSFRAVWRCPCVQGDCPPKSCPVQLYPCPTTLSIDTQSVSGITSTGGAGGDNPRLHTILNSQIPGPKLSESILDSIEKTGHCTDKGLSFQATICRVFCRRLKTQPYLSWSILAEDSHGVFAVIQLPDHSSHLENWRDVLQWEMQSITVTAVTLLSRTNKERDPCLFSVLESVWGQTARPELESSTNDSSSQVETVPRPAPGFCYLMKAWHERSGVQLSHDLPQTSDPRLKVTSYELKNILNSSPCVTDADSRRSFLFKVFYVDEVSIKKERRPYDTCCQVVYVYDQSLTSGSTGSALTPRLYLMESCELSNMQLDPGDLVFVRDVYHCHGKLIADDYTRAVKMTNEHQSYSPWVPEGLDLELIALRKSVIRPFPLTQDTALGELVSVTGKISYVNEEECYIWQQCDQCDNSNLTSDPQTRTKISVETGNQSQLGL
ncbi:DNA repair-scaffolding protein-like [Liolophura sinensis]|uniref:DNA repair-scaffolding protein-like n=1 Tax=Liolophura sinensis TaxID=3198878 RepID=UPI0031592240